MRRLAGAVCALLLVGCARGETSSGCADFRPSSEPLADGAAVTRTVTVVETEAGNVLRDLDVNGGYYNGRVPALPLGTYPARVMRQGQLLTLTADGRTATLDGPIGCD